MKRTKRGRSAGNEKDAEVARVNDRRTGEPYLQPFLQPYLHQFLQRFLQRFWDIAWRDCKGLETLLGTRHGKLLGGPELAGSASGPQSAATPRGSSRGKVLRRALGIARTGLDPIRDLQRVQEAEDRTF